MLYPSINYMRYLFFVGHTVTDVREHTIGKLLCRDVSEDYVQLVHDELRRYVDSLVKINTPQADYAKLCQVQEFVSHYKMGVVDPDVPQALNILSYLPVRRLIDSAIILKESEEAIAASVNDKFYCNITPRAIKIYSHYFWNSNLTQSQWYEFLQRQDVFNYKNLVAEPLAARKFKADMAGHPVDSHEFNYIASKTYERLETQLLDANSDPDTCMKWFKIFDAARTKAPGCKPISPIAPKSTSADLTMGLTEFSADIRSVEDFVTPTNDEDDTDINGPVN